MEGRIAELEAALADTQRKLEVGGGRMGRMGGGGRGDDGGSDYGSGSGSGSISMMGGMPWLDLVAIVDLYLDMVSCWICICFRAGSGSDRIWFSLWTWTWIWFQWWN